MSSGLLTGIIMDPFSGLAPVPASKAPVAPVAAPQAQAPNASVLTQDGDKEAKTL